MIDCQYRPVPGRVCYWRCAVCGHERYSLYSADRLHRHCPGTREKQREVLLEKLALDGPDLVLFPKRPRELVLQLIERCQKSGCLVGARGCGKYVTCSDKERGWRRWREFIAFGNCPEIKWDDLIPPRH